MTSTQDSLFPIPNIQRVPRKHVRIKPNPMAYRVVSVRLREAEHVSLMSQVEPLGMSANLAMRIAARRIAGFLEVDAQTREQLAAITAEIGEISDAMTILGQEAAQSHSVDMNQLSELRVAFGKEFARLDAQLQAIMNVSKRRQDGQKLLLASAK